MLTQLSLKWLFFCLGIPTKFQEHDFLTFRLLHVNNQDLIHTLTCTAGSIKVALGIGNWVIVSHCLVVTQGNHIALFGMPKCPITNLYLISYIQCSFWTSDNHKLSMTSIIFIDYILNQNLLIISCPYKKICSDFVNLFILYPWCIKIPKDAKW